jgi:hypothetical protein
MSNHFVSRASFTAAVLAAFVAGCGNPETGIPTRHLQGIVTLPPLALAEIEPADEELIVADLENDSLQTADGPYGIGFAYHVLRGSSHSVCDRVEADLTADDLCGFTDDEDWFRLKSQYQGPIVFKARPALTPEQEEADVRADVDFELREKDGTIIWTDTNAAETVLDDNGDPVLDDEGNPRTTIPDPRFATQVIDGNEFFVKVTVNSDAEEPVAYELVIVGNDPRNHRIDLGIEGDAASFDFGAATEPPREAAYEIKVGAYLSGDVDHLGEPVGGTACESWNLDLESETFWCSWDMVFLNQVTTVDAAIIPGKEDGLDNECNGVADSGTEDVDADGDGYTIKEGDCNDTDPDVGPFRGDTWGDRKDNDCNGWADTGPDDVDDDGDGYCENGRDLNGDGVCRGPSEVAGGLAGGDCNDADPTIRPSFDGEIPNNGLDDDCFNGDGRLDQTNSDDPNDAAGGNVDEWTDLEEIACGSDPNDAGDDPPPDADEDGLCDSTCLGTVGCAQDWDGDGLHNWLEFQCNMDPNTAGDELPDFDGDGVCDGLDLDADNDGFERLIGQEGDDCNDLDPSVHPHPVDPDTEQLIASAFNYDIVDSIDNDCDGLIDENRDWLRSGDGFVVNTDWTELDQDGDGFTLAERDCDDTNDQMYFGNWEVRSANVVSTDFSLVHLFGGEFSSLNTTSALPGERTATETVPYDVQTKRVAWELMSDWEEGDPPTLRPTASALPRIDVWYAKQPEVGKLWFEALDANGNEIYDDVDSSGFSIPAAPWAEGTYQDLGETAAAGKTNELSGASSEVVANSWDGDNDGYRIVFPEGGLVNVKLDWEGAKDLDAVLYCYYFDSVNPPNYYSGIFRDGGGGGLADVTKPEEGTTIVPLPPGSDCYVYIVQYSGTPGPYTFEVTVLEE